MYIEVIRTKKIEPEYFSESELREMEKLADGKKSGWLASRLAVKKAIQKYFRETKKKTIAFDEIEIISRKFSRPIFKIRGKEIKNVAISLSHSNGTGAGAVGAGKLVGVDIEQKRIFSREFKQNFLTQQELQWLKKFPKYKNNEMATLFWCIKESYLKAIGAGLRKHPKEVEVKMDRNNKTVIFDKEIKTRAKVIRETNKNYSLAAVTI